MEVLKVVMDAPLDHLRSTLHLFRQKQNNVSDPIKRVGLLFQRKISKCLPMSRNETHNSTKAGEQSYPTLIKAVLLQSMFSSDQKQNLEIQSNIGSCGIFAFIHEEPGHADQEDNDRIFESS